MADNASESPPEEEQAWPKKQRLDEEEDDNKQPLEEEKEKQKLEEEDDNKQPQERTTNYEDSDDEFTDEEFQRYIKQVNESGGFDIDKIPNKYPLGFIIPVSDLDRRTEDFVEDIEELKALDKYNSDNDTQYEFVKVHKLNLQIVSGFMFYITFEATGVAPANGCEHSTHIFQARVYSGIEDREVDFCRLKPSYGAPQMPRACC
ncbi:unnamed protein product [Ilex paraguariensis]|uniref:Cystatin domain-containing protein n=1 Tax=Ilex paraguariensis TaxID=185542 RepID=A0ABC8REP2_9AQUA